MIYFAQSRGSSAIRLTPTRYPRWTGLVKGLAAGQSLEWKCFKKADGATSLVRETTHKVCFPG